MNTPASSTSQSHPPHVESDQYRNSPPAANPQDDLFNIVVSVPDNIKIRMVDASALGDYEIWVFIASILSNAVVGFLVAYFQAIDAKSASTSYIGWTWLVFFVLFALAIGTAIAKRLSLKQKGRDIKVRTSSATVSEKKL